MAAPTSGVCGAWCDEDDVLACCTHLDPDPPLIAEAIEAATNILFRLSGRQFPGECTIEGLRPCQGSNCGCGGEGWAPWGSWSFWYWDALTGNVWSAFPVEVGSFFPLCGPCHGLCELPFVRLPAPVVSITQVVIDGAVLDPSAYEVKNYTDLVRTDGNGWPCTNDGTKDSSAGSTDAENTWEISYTYGRLPDAGGVRAAARLACELARLWCGADDCLLTPYAKQLDREGITLEINDPNAQIAQGRTGIPDVDMWLLSVNPQRLQRRGRIYRMGGGHKPYRSTTWPP